MSINDAPHAALGAVWFEAQERGLVWLRRVLAEVTEWRWASGETSWERPEPLWSEMRGHSSDGRAMSEPRGELGYVARYGYDGTGALRIARRAAGGTDAEPRYYDEVFWVSGPDGQPLLLEFHYDGIREPRPLRLRCITAPASEGDVLTHVVRWSGPPTGGGREVYDRQDGVITRVTEESYVGDEWVPRWEYDCSYADGQLAMVTASRVNEDGSRDDPYVVFRRSSGKAVRDAKRRLAQEVPDRVAHWAARVTPDEPVFALALLYSSEGPSVPPALGLATDRDRVALLSARADDPLTLWNPAEWSRLDPEPAELLTDDLSACWQLLAQEWETTSDDREPRAMLIKAARAIPPALRAIGFSSKPVVYAIDDELTDLDRNLKPILTQKQRAALEGL